jgi:outer membrane receptor protein involved in Fe transport
MIAASVFSIAVAMLASPASAQDVAESAEGSEIIVTATKRAERLIDVPLAISVIDSSSMASQNLLTIKDYVSRVPGLAASDAGNGRVQIAIRGITTGGLSNATVGVTIDDIPVNGSGATSYGSVLVPELDPGIIQRLEVLKGPQGTLYGASSLGGLMRYVTVQPSFKDVSGSASVSGTSVSHGGQGYGVRGMLNVPLDSTVAVVLSGFYRRDPGYVDDAILGLENVNRQDVSGGRAALLWQPVSGLEVKLAALYQHSSGDGSASVDTDASFTPLTPYNHTNVPRTGPYRRTIQLYSGELNWDLGFATLTSLTGYNYSKFSSVDDTSLALSFYAVAGTGNPNVVATTYFSVWTKKFSQELRLTSPTSTALEWMLGAFYNKERSAPLYNLVAVDPADGAIVADDIFVNRFPTRYKEYAAFLNLTYHFTDRFDVQLGGRYGNNSQFYHETIEGPLAPGYDVRTRSKENTFTYSVSPRFRINPNMTLYARVSSGYRPGGPNTAITPTTPEAFASDTTTNYEIGFKGDLIDHTLYLEASAFRIDWKDIQLQLRDPVTQFVYFDNAGGARSQGFELSLTARPSPGLTIAGTIGYTDATLTEDAPSVAGSPKKGDRLPFTSPWSASLSVDKAFELRNDLRLSLGATIAYLDKRLGNYNFDGQVMYPAYTTVDLRAGLSAERWNLSLFASNLFDKAAAISGDTRASGSPLYAAVFNRPRTLGVEMGYKF